jgi:hypothetical protein
VACVSICQDRNSRTATDPVNEESAMSISLDREGRKFLQLSACVCENKPTYVNTINLVSLSRDATAYAVEYTRNRP